MPAAMGVSLEDKGLRSHRWLLSYKTSATIIDGRPVKMLHDFYLPALRLAVCYDRVAGYFRSSSLAAASQGFSAFVGRQGKMRLIVGADLEPEDVRAILAGDRERLAARLNAELDQPATWPADIRNGVALLAWMVAQGYLEVRVAFRVHLATGEPLAFNSQEDGYVHEKWFILDDEYGNRLYGSGTLNESRTGLVLNAENIDIHCDWWGEMDSQRVVDAAAAFDNLWQGRVKHMPVVSLPEAVQRRLLRIAEGLDCPVEIDGATVASAPVELPSALERLRFAVLRDAPQLPGGRYVGLETAPVQPWPHQAIVVRRLVETWPYSYLVCDEVGLGKTIEAGLAFRSLYLAGLAKRILIAAPAGLTQQWQRQMASKMLLPFGRVLGGAEISHEYIFPVAEKRAAASLYEPDLVICSTGLLARRERAMGLQAARQWDIGLVDEAHAARRRNPSGGCAAYPDYGRLYTTIRDYLRPAARCLWLATATPMQIDPVEICDLLALTNRAGAFQYDPTLTLAYYDVLGQIVQGEEPGKQEWEFLRRAVQAVQKQDQIFWRFLEDSVIDGRIRSPLRQWLEHGRIPQGRNRQLLQRLLFSAAPLSRVMLRHTRRLLEIYREHGQLQQNLAQRHILPIPPISFAPAEQRAYDQLEDYCEGLSRQIQRHGNRSSQSMVRLLLSFLRLRFASSLYALRETLRRRLNKVEATLQHQLVLEAEQSEMGASALQFLLDEGEDEDDLVAVETLLKDRTQADLRWERRQLSTMLDNLADLSGLSSKMQELLQRLDQRHDRQTGRIRQTVIFTRFYDTLVDIVARLQQVNPGMLVGTYSGQGAGYFDPVTGRMLRADREEVKERFMRGEFDVLVCTDAAAEGLNLQTADFLVNFDLGWNPMKVEQRIGRIDRIGQKHEHIFVLNLCYTGSAEEIVYSRLLSRLSEANMIVGTQQISLLPVALEEFQQLAEGTLTLAELEISARAKIEQQRQLTGSMELNPGDLYEIYMRMDRSRGHRPPVNLAGIWEALTQSRYLGDLGCVVSMDAGKPTLRMAGIDGLPDGVFLTISRELYDEGLADGGNRIHFASYGDPLFDTLLEHMSHYKLPPCVRRITVPAPGLDGVEVVGYAAACLSNNGIPELRLVRSWRDLADLQLAESVSLTDAEVGPLRVQLEQEVRAEFRFYQAAESIERANLRAARAQEMLNFLVIRDLLGVRGRSAGEGALFGPVVREVAALFKDREEISVPDLPAEMLRPVAGDLLFDCQVPVLGDKASLSVSRILGRAAIDAACRLADSMKRPRNETYVAAVLSRLQREAQARWRMLQ